MLQCNVFENLKLVQNKDHGSSPQSLKTIESRILVWILDEVFLKQSCLPNQDIGSRESLGDMCEASGAGHAVFYIKSRGNMREPGLSPSILGATVMLFFHIFPLNMLNHC